ncbi:hypothetical protein CIPAW_12G023200 [Carya illinoinensis]|uniref:PGG domain-containing protein n=1 Tax=Carya illinoinensis TaxID=32201 RepID=A0A8T1NTU4_CARIL|nr:hypothetical protein CIPAW_12G023200 [Carya illinoinensis]
MAEHRDVEELDKLSELYKAVRDGDFHKTGEILMSLLDNTVNWEIPDKGQTVLHTAVTYGHEDIVEALVMKMSNEGLAMYDSHGYTALSKAAVLGKQQMEIQDHNGATLFTRAIYIGTLDIALDLIQRCPRSALALDKDDESPILALASMRHSVPSKTQLGFWKQRIYSWKIHDPYIELLSLMSEEISNSKPQKLKDGLVHSAICQATKNGIFEFVSKMLKTDLEFITVRDEDDRNLFMLAVLHRHEKIFSILYSQDMMMNYYSFMKCLLDVDGNNILHMAGIIEHSTPVNQIPGAALQIFSVCLILYMQEVGKIVHPKDKKTKNKNGFTPQQLFTRNHKNMMKEGEKWMKDTAGSCTVVGALIITIMFAVTFTIPGGNNQDTGLPIFLKKSLFGVFMISDALSFFLSSTSVLMFLGILTSRYTEDDFLEYLPRQMIIGLFTLFCSIATMMITFASALLIILHEQLRISIPLISLLLPETCQISLGPKSLKLTL